MKMVNEYFVKTADIANTNKIAYSQDARNYKNDISSDILCYKICDTDIPYTKSHQNKAVIYLCFAGRAGGKLESGKSSSPIALTEELQLNEHEIEIKIHETMTKYSGVCYHLLVTKADAK